MFILTPVLTLLCVGDVYNNTRRKMATKGKIGGSYFDRDVPEVVLRSLFQKYDKSQTGVLSQTEVRDLLQNDFGMKADQAKAYEMLLDEDGSKSISFEELHNWFKSGERFKHIGDSTRYVTHSSS